MSRRSCCRKKWRSKNVRGARVYDGERCVTARYGRDGYEVHRLTEDRDFSLRKVNERKKYRRGEETEWGGGEGELCSKRRKGDECH